MSGPDHHRTKTVWGLVVFTGLAFGSGGLLAKLLIDEGVDAFTVTAFPVAIGAVLAWIVAWTKGEVSRAALWPGAILGITTSTIPPLFFNIGFETLSAGLVTLIITLAPAVTAAVAHLVFTDERFNPLKGLGLAMAVGGVLALVAAPGVIEGASYTGAVWTIAGAVVGGCGAVLARWFAVRHGGFSLVPPQLTVAAIAPVIAGLVVGRSLVPRGGFTARDIAIMGAVGIVASYAGLRSMMLANERGTTGQVAMVAYIIPLVGVIGGIIFFNEVLTLWIVLGGILILGGVTVGGRGSRPTPRSQRAR